MMENQMEYQMKTRVISLAITVRYLRIMWDIIDNQAIKEHGKHLDS